MKKCIIISFFTAFVLFSCSNKDNEEQQPLNDTTEFSFAFMTDIHLQPERGAVEGFKMAIDTVNKLKPDFVITGGDLIMDALGQTYGRSDSLYKLFEETSKYFEVPVYNTLGNHELFGLYENSGIDTTHEEYFRKMYEKRLGERYYAFNHKGWRFYVLDAIDKTKERRYIGSIDKEQVEWLEQDLMKVDSTTPIVISVHIPLMTAFTQLFESSQAANGPGLVVANTKEILDVFSHHNLKVVMQGHLHIIEDIYINDIHFITGGAVSSGWWHGKNHGMEEGFMMVKLNSNGLVGWDYIDYGWEAIE